MSGRRHVQERARYGSTPQLVVRHQQGEESDDAEKRGR